HDANVGAERFERAPRARIDVLDRAGDDAHVRQLAAEPSNRLHEPQRLAEVFGSVFGDAADDDLGGADGFWHWAKDDRSDALGATRFSPHRPFDDVLRFL